MWIESKFGLPDSETRGEVSVPSTEAAREFYELLLTEVTSKAVYHSQRFHFGLMQNTRAKALGSVKATFGQSMTFGTPEEQLPMATIQKRQGSVIPVCLVFAVTGQNLSMEHAERGAGACRARLLLSSMDRKGRL